MVYTAAQGWAKSLALIYLFAQCTCLLRTYLQYIPIFSAVYIPVSGKITAKHLTEEQMNNQPDIKGW